MLWNDKILNCLLEAVAEKDIGRAPVREHSERVLKIRKL